MARPEILGRIQDAEREAEEIIEQSDDDREEIETERQEILEAGEEEREERESRAEERMDDAVEYVVEQFVERGHAQT